MKKFVLLNSPIFWNSEGENENYLSPIGLGYIATRLEEEKIEVELVDCVKEKLSVGDIITYLNQANPDFWGINIFTQNYSIVKYIVEKMKIKGSCFIGGQVVKSIFNEILEWNVNSDLNIIIGEGEYIIPSIVLDKCAEPPFLIKKNMKVYKVDKHSIYYPKDISNVRLNRKYLGNEIIENHYGEKEAAMITSRGCVYNCAFCGGARGLNEDVSIRIRSEESVKNEIEEIKLLYPDVKSIRILDDLFLRNRESIDMAQRIFSQFPQLSWRAMVHVLSLVSSTEKIKLLKECNCRELFMGIESGSMTIRKRINKLGEIDDVIKVAEAILANGIDLKGYFMYGFPKETKADFEATYKLAQNIVRISRDTKGKFRTSVFQFRPYHGTQLYNEILEENGSISPCHPNETLKAMQKRAQFNFSSGNYSSETDEILNEYIIKTQSLTLS